MQLSGREWPTIRHGLWEEQQEAAAATQEKLPSWAGEMMGHCRQCPFKLVHAFSKEQQGGRVCFWEWMMWRFKKLIQWQETFLCFSCKINSHRMLTFQYFGKNLWLLKTLVEEAFSFLQAWLSHTGLTFTCKSLDKKMHLHLKWSNNMKYLNEVCVIVYIIYLIVILWCILLLCFS